MPLYHSHTHDADYHHEGSDDHVLLRDESLHEGLSTGQQHNGAHLHIKNTIGRTDTHLRFKNSSLKQGFTVTETPVFTYYPSCSLAKHTQSRVFRSNPYEYLSGLSPPAA